jgi:hypothetical protein
LREARHRQQSLHRDDDAQRALSIVLDRKLVS